jgi:CelD/BcsL family acetyltransferase involved in cellulose biosynthesis
MAELRVRALEAQEWPQWDAFVAGHPHGTLFQTTEWLGRLAGRLVVLALEQEPGGPILGGLPLLHNRRFRVEGYHPPALTAYMGPLVEPGDSDKEDVRRSAYQLGVQRLLGAVPRAGHVDFLLHPDQTNALPYLWNGYTTDLGYTNVISGTVEEFLQRMSYGHRKRLRRLQRLQEAGQVELLELEDPTELFSLLEATMRTKRFRYDMDAIRRLFTPDGYQVFWKAVKVQAEGEPLACALSAFDAGTYYSLVGGVSRTGNSDLANAHLLCFDYMIRQALESGRRFDFCGSSLPGVDHFNRRYGGRLLPRIRVQKSRSLLMSALRAAKQLRQEWRPPVLVE